MLMASGSIHLTTRYSIQTGVEIPSAFSRNWESPQSPATAWPGVHPSWAQGYQLPACSWDSSHVLCPVPAQWWHLWDMVLCVMPDTAFTNWDTWHCTAVCGAGVPLSMGPRLTGCLQTPASTWQCWYLGWLSTGDGQKILNFVFVFLLSDLFQIHQKNFIYKLKSKCV